MGFGGFLAIYRGFVVVSLWFLCGKSVVKKRRVLEGEKYATFFRFIFGVAAVRRQRMRDLEPPHLLAEVRGLCLGLKTWLDG